MAIWAYVGLPRHGKSYNVVREQILPALRSGRRVVTNIPLNEAACRSQGHWADGAEIVQVDDEQLAKDPATVLQACTGGALVVFDELWRHLPQGSTANKVDPAWKTLFAEHGHRVDERGRMMQICLVTQDLSQVAAFARALVERTVVISKLLAVGVSSRFRSSVYSGAVTGLQPPIARRVSEEYSAYEAAVFECYRSRTMSEAGDGAKVDERSLDKRGTLLRHPTIKYLLPLAVLAGVWGVWQVIGFFHKEPPAAPAAQAGASAPARAAVPPRRAVLTTGRVAGILWAMERSSTRVLLVDDAAEVWVGWRQGRCQLNEYQVVTCEKEGRIYVAGYDLAARRAPVRGAGIGEIFGIRSDAGGSRE